jgi:hypothetical protein
LQKNEFVEMGWGKLKKLVYVDERLAVYFGGKKERAGAHPPFLWDLSWEMVNNIGRKGGGIELQWINL